MKILKLASAVTALVLSTTTNAALIQITGTSAASGELGWFAIDDAVLLADADQRLTASQFLDYSFSDPLSSVVINPADVPSDTGTTIFGNVGGVWTVTGGAGNSLTALDGSTVWIAGSTYLNFGGGGSYSDVTWNTTDYPSSVPVPAAIWLFGSGLIGLVGFARHKKV